MGTAGIQTDRQGFEISTQNNAFLFYNLDGVAAFPGRGCTLTKKAIAGINPLRPDRTNSSCIAKISILK